MHTTIHCPECERLLRVPDDMLGRKVKCPTCGTTFVAEAGEQQAGEGVRPARPQDTPTTPYAPEAKESEAPRRKPRRVSDEEDRDDDDFEEEEDDDRPRGRRRRRLDYADADEDVARSAVAGPAIALMIVGGISLALYLINLVLTLAGVGMMAANNAQAQGGAGAARMFGGVLGAVIALCWAGFVLAGAMKMKALTNRGVAMAACIVAMVPCNVCCILGLPFGIWGLVVLNREEVRSAFR